VEIDPNLAPHLARLVGVTHAEAISDPRFAAVRAAIPAPAAPNVRVRDETVPGPHGDVPVRVYEPPRPADSRPGLVWLHGGGWVTGDLDMAEADFVSRFISARAGAVVISVDYRLALDGVHFPVPLDDCVAALRSTRAAAPALGIDPDRLSLGGASAGGNLAAATALVLRDAAEPLPASLLLVYPLMHPELPALPADIEEAMAELPDVLRLRNELVQPACLNYAGSGAATRDPRAFPAYADLRGLSPTLVLVSEYDDLRTSGKLFAEQLRAAAVETHLVVEPGVPHGHLDWPGLKGTDRSLARLANWVSGSRA
jgi:acetyl esterase